MDFFKKHDMKMDVSKIQKTLVKNQGLFFTFDPRPGLDFEKSKNIFFRILKFYPSLTNFPIFPYQYFHPFSCFLFSTIHPNTNYITTYHYQK
jgi:hypothetical protein